MPEAKKKEKAAPPAQPDRRGEYRYRDSDSESTSVTVLTYGAAADSKRSVLVNGCPAY